MYVFMPLGWWCSTCEDQQMFADQRDKLMGGDEERSPTCEPCSWGPSPERLHSRTPGSSLSARRTAGTAASPGTETGPELTEELTEELMEELMEELCPLKQKSRDWLWVRSIRRSLLCSSAVFTAASPREDEDDDLWSPCSLGASTFPPSWWT